MHKPQPKYGWWGPEGKTATITIAPTGATPKNIYDLDWDESSHIPIERDRHWVMEDHQHATSSENYRNCQFDVVPDERPISAWVQRALAIMEETGATRALPAGCAYGGLGSSKHHVAYVE